MPFRRPRRVVCVGVVLLALAPVALAGPPGDMDGDRDTDLADFLAFQPCYTGPGLAVEPACVLADLDGDGDADLVAFQAALTGDDRDGDCVPFFSKSFSPSTPTTPTAMATARRTVTRTSTPTA